MNGMKAAIAAVGTKILTIASAVIAVVLVGYSGYVIYDSIHTNRAAFSSWDLSEYRPSVNESGKISFETMMETNPDTVAWLTIQGTNIDYPVVQGQDDLEYASKDVFGNSSLSGSIYLTVQNSRDFTNSFNLIYGHHMENGAMFGDIEKYEDLDYFKSHQDGILVTPLGTYDLHVFARISTDAYDSRIYSAGDRKSSDFPDFLFYVQSLALQWDDSFDIYEVTDHIQTYLTAREANIAENGEFVFDKMPQDAVENGMQMIALSTCADATTNGRQALIATMKIRTEPLPTEMIADNDVPLAAWGHGISDYWSLIDLICVVLTVYTLLPGSTIGSKFGRVKMMKAANGTGSHFRYKEFQKKLSIGIIAEAAVTVIAVILLIRTQNFHEQMTLVDAYTPIMVALYAAVWILDVLLVRYHEKEEKEESVPV